jgi:hypothetical protein
MRHMLPLSYLRGKGKTPRCIRWRDSTLELTEIDRLGDLVNDWRVSSLGLEPVPGMEGHRLAEALEIPFTYCWSPSLVPKPSDWGSHISMASC